MKFKTKIISLFTAFSMVIMLSKSIITVSAEDEIALLKDVYKDKFLIGTCVSSRDLSGKRHEALLKYFNAATCENAMKPDAMQKAEGKFTFSDADKIVEDMISNDIAMIGHTLAWHQQSPKWMNQSGVSRDIAIRNLEDHINSVAGHYAGKILSWDVVNEAIDDSIRDSSDWKGSLRRTDWYNAIGDDYIEIAFRAAEKADPNALLYYNDYNIEQPSKREATYHMVKALLDNGVKVDGIGIQGHYNIYTSAQDVSDAIERFASLGVKISITELDVTVPNANGGLTEAQEEQQAEKYAELFKVFIEHSDVIERVTFWGIDDASSWRANQYPLLFDSNLNPKAAYYAVLDPYSYEGIKAEPQTGTASFGSAVIDGEIDEAWNNAQQLPINQFVLAWQAASGNVRVLWDEKYLYALFEVKDNVLNSSSFQVYEHDSVEVFIDEENNKSTSFDKYDGQYRVDIENKLTFGDTTLKDNVMSAVKKIDGGYIAEIAVPFRNISPKNNDIIGFDAQINDANNSGMRISIAKWSDPSDESYKNTLRWGNLTLVKDEASVTNTEAVSGNTDENLSASAVSQPNTEQASSNTDDDSSSNGIQLSTILLIAGGALIAFSIIFGIIKRRNK